MIRVITYGTFDLLHEGHVRLLKRAKTLGDYLIVGVTSDDYDRVRGKINAVQSFMERVEAVKALGIADQIIIEEYDGQKIDDIKRYGIDIFTVGSDWVGKFDYLKEYCRVHYLPRTKGVSSSKIRAMQHTIRLGIYGNGRVADKYKNESSWINGLECIGVAHTEAEFRVMLRKCDAVYIQSHPRNHVRDITIALNAGKHVICETPIALSAAACKRMFKLAEERGLILMDAIKTAYSTAYNRMLLLVKSGKIGEVVSVDATCTSLMEPYKSIRELKERWNSRQAWAPAALLSVFQLLGVNYIDVDQISLYANKVIGFDVFTKYDFRYANAVASVKVGKGVKSEGSLVVSGTKGYVYVPAPWWKTDYFEVRYENVIDNRRYYYQLDGEGIRNELVWFVKKIYNSGLGLNVSKGESILISEFCGRSGND